MINIDLLRRKSFGCLTRVVHKSSWAKLKPRHAAPQKTQPVRVKWNIYFTLLTQHMNGFVSKKAFWSKIAVAGHGKRYLFRLTFSRIIFDLRDNAFPVSVRQTYWKRKAHVTQTIVCRLIVSVLQPTVCSTGFCYCLLLLTPNYQWIQVEWSGAFSKHPKKATL